MNAENKPLPIKDFAAPHLLHAEGTKPLPPGARRLGLGAKIQLGAELPPSPCPIDIPFSLCRVAFLRWEFPNFSNRGKELLGRYAMARRHVQAAGFLLVDVSSPKFCFSPLFRGNFPPSAPISSFFGVGGAGQHPGGDPTVFRVTLEPSQTPIPKGGEVLGAFCPSPPTPGGSVQWGRAPLEAPQRSYSGISRREGGDQ